MTQEYLDFGRDSRVKDVRRRVLRAVSDAVDAMGLIVAAGACDARRSELADALAGREGRYLRIEWALAIADAAPPDFRRAILEAIAAPLGFTVVPARPRTAEEKLALVVERVTREFGAAGARLVEEVAR